MSDDVRHSLIWATAIVVMVTALIAATATHSVIKLRAHSDLAKTAMEAGLVEHLSPSSQFTYWAKPSSP